MKVVLPLLCWLFLTACNQNSKTHQGSNTVGPEASTSAKYVDLSHSFSSETVYWVTAEEFHLDSVFKGMTEKGYYYAANNFSAAEHGGTHLDAPIHFSESGQSTDEIPLDHLIGPAIKIDVTAAAADDPDYLISEDDLRSWEVKNGIQIPQHSIVLLQTGHSKYYPDPKKYLGTAAKGPDAVKDLHFPGLSPEAAIWLIQNRNVKAVGIDTPSIDYGQSEYFKTHVILLGANIPVFENLTRLEDIPDTNFEVFALPMKIKGGSGGPLRIIALIK
ncbi:cyclase family protein [Robertkochia solimangrovi]|nr:cyclase family protein [Robertkochia solimangrovi]